MALPKWKKLLYVGRAHEGFNVSDGFFFRAGKRRHKECSSSRAHVAIIFQRKSARRKEKVECQPALDAKLMPVLYNALRL